MEFSPRFKILAPTIPTYKIAVKCGLNARYEHQKLLALKLFEVLTEVRFSESHRVTIYLIINWVEAWYSG